MEQGSLLVVLASIYGGVFGGFMLAGKVQGAAIADGRWVLFVVGMILMCASVSRTAASPRAAHTCSPACGDPSLTPPP